MYLDFEETISELENFYNNLSTIKNSLIKNKNSFLDNEFTKLNQILRFILKKPWFDKPDNYYFGDWNPEYLLLGHYFEGLLRTILMKELSYSLFFEKCTTKKETRYILLGRLFEQFTALEKIKMLSLEQQQRIVDVLTITRIQRNQQAHSKYKSMDANTFRFQIYTLILKIHDIFNLKLTDENNEKLCEEINNNIVISGLDYSPIW